MGFGLNYLQEWYFRQCDGDWEHQFGVDLTFVSSPGWRLRVEVSGTALEKRILPSKALPAGDGTCSCDGTEFLAEGSIDSLSNVLYAFEEWARLGSIPFDDEDVWDTSERQCVLFLSEWARDRWRHVPADAEVFCVKSLDNPGWSTAISVVDSPVENRKLDRVVSETQYDWLDFRADGEWFYAAAGPLGLTASVTRFVEWSSKDPSARTGR